MTTELISIQHHKDVQALYEYLKHNPSRVHKCDLHGWLPLHSFALNGWVEGVRVLLEFKADVNAWKAGDDTPLHLAVIRNQSEIVRLLIEAGADGNAINENGYMPVDEAVERYHFDVVTHLPKVYPVIFEAIIRGTPKAVHRLLKAGASANVYRPIGTSPLHWAVMCSRNDVVDALIAAGVEVNEDDYFGRTPLHLAPSARMAEQLIGNGANVNYAPQEGSQITPLYAVVRRGGSKSLVQTILMHGAEVDAQTSWGETPLCTAAFNASLDILDLLIAHGADVNHQTEDGDTPSHIALAGVQTEKVLFLIKHGADANIKNDEGISVRDEAVEKGYSDIIELLDRLSQI